MPPLARSRPTAQVEWTRGALLAHLMGGSSGAGAEKKAGGAKGRGNLSETGPNRVAVVFGVRLCVPVVEAAPFAPRKITQQQRAAATSSTTSKMSTADQMNTL